MWAVTVQYQQSIEGSSSKCLTFVIRLNPIYIIQRPKYNPFYIILHSKIISILDMIMVKIFCHDLI